MPCFSDRPDRIVLPRIAARCVLGARPRERRRPRRVEVSVVLELALEEAARSDRLEATTDYSRVAAAVREAVLASRFHLIEALAVHLAETVLARFPGVEGVEVRVAKPGALRNAGPPEVQVRRRRP